MTALNIVKNDHSDSSSSPSRKHLVKNAKLKEIQAIFERRWLLNPEAFDPLRNCMTRECLERTWSLLIQTINPLEKKAVDIGCGMGVLSKRLHEAKVSQITVLDIAENALKRLKETNLENIQYACEAMPFTTLADQHYDIIICTDLIGEIPQEYHRLFFAELSRLISADGDLVFSSSIDIDSEGGVDKLKELIKTEFDLTHEILSFHVLYLRLKKLLRYPYLCTEGWSDLTFREKELNQRKGLNRAWYWINTTPILVWLWYVMNPIAHRLLHILKNNRTILLFLEKICHFISDQDGISHVIFIAKRRSLQPINPKDIPITKPGKKEIWE
ncbi:MAG: class I SAM-dependent methyltransferase [Parachlamydiaceae bacterium]|nr:class I SAM-dependent methyltransferase [Parachlamydiaceae bacterium]